MKELVLLLKNLLDWRQRCIGLNRNVVATISHNEYKNVFLNNICLRYSMNRMQSKNDRIVAYKSAKFLYHALMIKYSS